MNYQERINNNNRYYARFAENLKKRSEKRSYCELIKVFKSHIPDNKGLILDIGCGHGLHIPMFLEDGYSVLGIEPCQALIDLSDYSQYIRKGTYEELNTYEFEVPPAGIWATASFLHVPEADSARVLSYLYDVLQENGALFISVRLGSGHKLDSYDSTDSDEIRFIQLHNEDALKDKITNAGFEIQYERVEDSYWGRKAKWISIIATK